MPVKDITPSTIHPTVTYGFLRLRQVAEMLGISKSSVWAWAKAGRIPKPVKLAARTTVWRAVEIIAFIETAGRPQAGKRQEP